MSGNLQELLIQTGLELPSNWPRFVTYAMAAIFCAILGHSGDLAKNTRREVRQLWLWLSALYFLASGNALVQGDTLLVQWARDFARDHNAYDQRRFFQFVSLAALLLLASASWKRVQRSVPHSTQYALLMTGAGGTLLLHMLRFVSFHYTDLALNAAWLNLSVATWLECASLGLVAAGTGLELLRSHGHV